jgi:hypothetical protein
MGEHLLGHMMLTPRLRAYSSARPIFWGFNRPDETIRIITREDPIPSKSLR